MSAPQPCAVTWEALTAAEADLLRLESLARWIADHADPQFCANAPWYDFLKPQLVEMIGHRRGYPRGTPAYEPARGWPADNPLHVICLGDPDWWAHADKVRATRYPVTGAAEEMLRGSEAYDVAYEHLYELLPDCRHEGVCRG